MQGPTRTSQCKVVPPPCSSHLRVDTSSWSASSSDAGADKDIALQGSVTPLPVASQRGRLEVVALLSDAGADKDIAMQGGATPLLVASKQAHQEVVRFFSDAGADKDIAMQDATPLFIAPQNGHLELLGHI